MKTGAGSMINRDTLAVTGPFLALIFGWCSVGTIWLGRLGRYFVFAVARTGCGPVCLHI